MCKKVMLEPLDFIFGAIGAGAGIAVTKFAADKIESKIDAGSKLKQFVRPAVGGGVAVGAFMARDFVPPAAALGAGAGAVLTGLHGVAKNYQSLNTLTDAVQLSGPQSTDPLGQFENALMDMMRASQLPTGERVLNAPQSTDPLGETEISVIDESSELLLGKAYNDPCG